MRDRYSGKSRGFGFVTFMASQDAQHVASMDHVVDGRRYVHSPRPTVQPCARRRGGSAWQHPKQRPASCCCSFAGLWS